MTAEIFIQGDAVICGMGHGNAAVADALYAREMPALGEMTMADGRRVAVSAVELPQSNLRRAGGMAETRNNQLAKATLDLLPDHARRQMAETAPARLGVVIGTSTAGIDEGGDAVAAFTKSAKWPDGFELAVQELGDPALFLAAAIGANGPAYAISTACTSGAKAIIAGARLIQQGLCDTVLCGGVDTLCDMTINGFGVLEATSQTRCNPFSINRSGIHIGEGAALFVLSATPGPLRVAGWGESSDAHHISAPDPEGRGAVLAIRAAMDMAGVSAENLGYLNLHGTATKQNDLMEAAAVFDVLGDTIPCSSTKPLTGHTLGAAGAIEAALLSMALQRRLAPRNRNDGAPDPALAHISLLNTDHAINGRSGMSCNYAFGGNNTSLILERCDG